MPVEKSDFDKFIEQFKERYPNARQLEREIAGRIQTVMNDIFPEKDISEARGFSIVKKGDSMLLSGSPLDWIILGITAEFIVEKVKSEIVSELNEIKVLKKELEIRDPTKIMSETILEFAKRIREGEYKFLWNTPIKRPLKEKIEEMLSKSEEEVLIMGWIGRILLDKVLTLPTQGIKIRILTHSPEGGSDPEVREAFPRLIEGIGKDNIKINKELHARMMIIYGREALISSADLTSHSFGKFESGVWTSDPVLVKSARGYFDKVWDDFNSTHPKEPKTKKIGIYSPF